MTPSSIAGVDGCKGGWLCVAIDATATMSAFVARDVQDLVERLPSDCRIGIDIPIGLPTTNSRQAELAARKVLGPRASSVFPVPLRVALDGATREAASDLQAAVHARGCRLSVQTWAILPKIREMDDFLGTHRDLTNRIFEVHPEVSFCHWNGLQPLSESKKRSAGKRQRSALIDSIWPGERTRIEAELRAEFCGSWAMDDLYDAFAALWSANRIVRGEAAAYPATETVDAEGLPLRILA
jgi:predicted RNase H-like nuclease